MKKCILLAGIGVLAACTAVSGVDRKQNGYLSITSRGRTSFASWNSVRNAGVKYAKAYCRDQHKEMHTVEIHTNGVRSAGTQSVEVVFECF
ncbi:hypothetical protein J8I87_32800 [Paraburkholderia sp. LEh10]|jgi:hypothetical protein|uniref:hypothetical protein n=1 Tax=Paraburkholderia sp. LEh10 TaxID=2821353 RepID=UPI001AE6EED6|nr:hypothetical protein [Paraburkholderia sp. LEh10]MBP0594362.1 hypothetical protein [Paraburkholderia sp. LEh10]